MKVVFTPIDNQIPNELTIGRTYDATSLDTQRHYYLLKNDEDHYYSYWKGNFTELSVYRKNQIEQILK